MEIRGAAFVVATTDEKIKFQFLEKLQAVFDLSPGFCPCDPSRLSAVVKKVPGEKVPGAVICPQQCDSARCVSRDGNDFEVLRKSMVFKRKRGDFLQTFLF